VPLAGLTLADRFASSSVDGAWPAPGEGGGLFSGGDRGVCRRGPQPLKALMPKLTPRELEQRSQASRTHGARSQALVTRRAAYVKQSVLQPLGMRQVELDGVARRHLDLYARCAAKVALMDAWADEHGWVDEEGRSPGFAREYVAMVNAAGRALARLDAHLKRYQQPAPLARIQRRVAAKANENKAREDDA